MEQDLIICRALASLYSHELLKQSLAFRGGTALHKLYLHPASRYSEDIDLVQINAGAAGPLMNAVQEALNPFLGTPRRAQKETSIMLTYRADSEVPPVQPLRLKVEVNTREHFTVEGLLDYPFQIKSQWFEGTCSIKTYSLNELLGTKLRALYQRRKGRDLYDLWLGLTKGGADPTQIVKTFQAYMSAEGHTVSLTEFRSNLAAKMKRKEFLGDTNSLLRSQVEYEPAEAYRIVDGRILELLD
ncbi:MAG: nucleotidyl transferase AbiEii/AbiGii toxin family protein [Bacteroidota bacterium]